MTVGAAVASSPPRTAVVPRIATWHLLGALLALGTIIRIPQLQHSLNGFHGFRQTQTAFLIRKYATDGIDLLSSPLPVFGRNSDVPLEFPLFQGLGALLVHAGLSTDVAARVLALLSFQAAGLFLALILLRWHGRMVALVALALFELLPLGLYWGTASLIDFFAVALTLAMVYLIDRWFTGGSALTLAAGSLAAVLAFLVKPTTAPSISILLLASAAMVIQHDGWREPRRRLLAGFALAPGLGLVAATIWTAYSDSVKETNPLTVFLTSSALREWNFGTLAQRVDPAAYFTILDRVFVHITGPALLLVLPGVLAAVVLPSPAQRVSTWAWLLVILSGPLIFLNLYVIHTYYLITIYPALVAVMAIGLVWAARLARGAPRQRLAALIGVAVILAGSLVVPEARRDIAGLVRPDGPPLAAIRIRDLTPAGSRIIMVGCGWNPRLLYYAEREGVMFQDPTPGRFWQTEPIADYPFLFLCAQGVQPRQWLPPGYGLSATRAPGLYKVIRER